MTKTAVERHTVEFAGHVQGVGFRYTTAAIAQQHAVTGFVQNLPDGRVLLVAEGAPAVVAAFVTAVELRLAQHVRNVTRDIGPATGVFTRFEIRH